MDFINHYNSVLGGITLASDGEKLTGLWFDDSEDFKDTITNLPVFEQTVKWLDIYFGGGIPDFTPPLEIRATKFRRQVYEIMLAIPYGKTMTYGEIADIIAKRNGIAKMSAQAVGGAVGYNPIAIIIPCHRVIGADGSLTGYAGGIDKKIKLLKLENIGVLRNLHPLSITKAKK